MATNEEIMEEWIKEHQALTNKLVKWGFPHSVVSALMQKAREDELGGCGGQDCPRCHDSQEHTCKRIAELEKKLDHALNCLNRLCPKCNSWLKRLCPKCNSWLKNDVEKELKEEGES